MLVIARLYIFFLLSICEEKNFHDHAVMSSQDSISTVYKCMMRGAADFLVKPIRRNELSNLWQHVWRRKAVCFHLPVIS